MWIALVDWTRKLAPVSAVTGAGAFTHFIHADDVYDTHRSHGKKWNELKADLERMLRFIEKHYPWLRFVSIREAHRVLSSIDAAGAAFQWKNDSLIIQSTPGLLLRIRLNDKKLKRSQGIRIVYRYKRSRALIVETTQTRAELFF